MKRGVKRGFEERLTALAGEAGLKTAKQLLKSGKLRSAWYGADGKLRGIFTTPAGMIRTAVVTGETPAAECSGCGDKDFCPHAAALLMYAGRFGSAAGAPEPPPRYYGGLKRDPLPALLARSGHTPAAELFIESQHTSPHLPSRWEKVLLQVRLKNGKREYIGNLCNLRQLYFDKSLCVSLKLEDFSLHDQQILRFLAINGEAQNSQILLNAEQTAELFHSLVNFPRFFRDGHPIVVRRAPAEPVLLHSGNKLAPGIRVENAALPTVGAQVITGRTGCWIGRDGEYFFIAADCDVGFLRSFFSAGVQQYTAKTAAEYRRNFPFPVVAVRNFEVKRHEPEPHLDGVFAGPEKLLLRLNFLYRDADGFRLFAPGSGILAADRGGGWKRDQPAERRFEAGLKMFGFESAGKDFLLTGIDRIGTFMNEYLPEMLRKHRNLALGSGLLSDGALCRLPEASLKCSVEKINADSFTVSYHLEAGTMPLEWNCCAECCAAFGNYIPAPDNRPVRIPESLAVFMRATPVLLRRHDPAERRFEVPFFNAAYYTGLTRNVPGALPPEIAAGPASRYAFLAPGYEFTGDLRNYQRDGVRFMQWMTDRNLNCLLADEMGLGKTVQLLALLASRLRRGDDPVLIVCPASLVTNWERETHRFVPKLRIGAPHGAGKAAFFKELSEYDVAVVSYAVARLNAETLRKQKFSFLVLDEAQHIKNPGSNNARSCKSIDAAHRIVLSGTPLENSPEDLWSIMDFLMPGMLGTLPAFRRKYADISALPELQEDLRLRISPFIKRRSKAEVATDLPPRTEVVLYCDFTPEQRELYDRVLAEGREELRQRKKNEPGSNAAIFSTLLRLRQICCHPALLPADRGNGIPSAKTELLTELLQENLDSSHKVLLFSQFTSLLALVIPELKESGVPFEYLDGSTVNRQEHVDNFNRSPEIPLFLLSLKAGGTGLNLTSADTVIIYDPWWNPAAELQAADRTHRIGQTRPVTVLKLVVRDSIEEKILALQGHTPERFDAVVNASERDEKLSIEELRELIEK